MDHSVEIYIKYLEALNFEFYDFLHFLLGEIYQINKASKMAKNGSFTASRICKIDFTQNVSNRKIVVFPHCGDRSF